MGITQRALFVGCCDPTVVAPELAKIQSTQLGKATDSVLLRRLILKIMWYMKGIGKFKTLKCWNK